jgi:hypothetical protein
LWVADGVPELRQTAHNAARAGERMLAAGWPDERSVKAALVEPAEVAGQRADGVLRVRGTLPPTSP